MNTREQIQARRIQTLERREAWLEQVVRALLRDLEFTESVGAAFAFDAGLETTKVSPYDHQAPLHGLETLTPVLLEHWRHAVATLENEAILAVQNIEDERRGIRRASDGSIISILPPLHVPEYDKAANAGDVLPTQADDPNLSHP